MVTAETRVFLVVRRHVDFGRLHHGMCRAR